MRLDIDSDWNDPIKGPICKTAKVFVDEIEQQLCTVADEEEGYVLKLKFPLNHNGVGFETIRVEGKVRIEIEPLTPKYIGVDN